MAESEGIDKPKSDSKTVGRGFESLRPCLTPGWTDHDVSDPGITLVELFPFLGEQLDYRNPQGRRRLLLVALALLGFFWALRDGD